MDYLNNHSPHAPAPLRKGAHLDVVLRLYTLDPITATPNQLLRSTYAACSTMDCILVPAIDPLSSLSEGCTEFVKERWTDLKVLFLTVCTGSPVLAQTGVLDRYHVAANKIGLKMVVDDGKLNRAVRWV